MSPSQSLYCHFSASRSDGCVVVARNKVFFSVRWVAVVVVVEGVVGVVGVSV